MLECPYLSRLKTMKSLWTFSNLCCNWPFWRGAMCATLATVLTTTMQKNVIRKLSSIYMNPEDFGVIKLEDACFHCISGPPNRMRTSCSSHVTVFSKHCCAKTKQMSYFSLSTGDVRVEIINRHCHYYGLLNDNGREALSYVTSDFFLMLMSVMSLLRQ